ncbi:MAG: hypothetical protein JOY69_05460 [Candidatus Eremiobacteraeota bacterium]|nr:hypothetical protein [Candidatus Eremiobacteraeota bacterium]
MSSAQAEREDRDQRNMEAMVRRLLRRTNDSYRLAAFPLAQTLCQASGIPNAQLALRHVVEAAFKNAPHEAQLRDLILASDLDAHLSRTESAAQLRVSRRHLQRYRAQAVSILARHIRDLIGPIALVSADGESLGDPLDILAEMVSEFDPKMASELCRFGSDKLAARADILELRSRVEAGKDIDELPASARGTPSRSLIAVLHAQSKQLSGNEAGAREALRPVLTDSQRDLRHDYAAQFELEWLMFLRARHHGDASEGARVATNLRRIAQDRAPWRSRALLAQAEARLRLGMTREARDLLDESQRLNLQRLAIEPLASSSVLRAEIAFADGDDTEAERLASGAYIVLRNRHYDSYRCLATIARARLRLGRPWTCSHDLSSLAPSAWDCVGVGIERARHLHDDGFTDDARECAAEAFRVSLALGYQGLAARAAATIAATLDEASQTRRKWFLRALRHLLPTRDQLLACDLYPSTNVRMDDASLGSFNDEVVDEIYTGLLTLVPQLGLEAEHDGLSARAYLRHLGHYVLGIRPSPERLTHAAEAVGNDSKAFAQFMLRFLDDVAAVLRPVFIALAHRRRRDDVLSRFNDALADFQSRARPRAHKQFLVG